MKNTLPPGIYEQVISNGLAQLLDALPAGRKDEGSIDAAEAPAILTDYLAAFLQQALTEIGEGSEAKEALPAQIALANELISFLQQKRQQAHAVCIQPLQPPAVRFERIIQIGRKIRHPILVKAAIERVPAFHQRDDRVPVAANQLQIWQLCALVAKQHPAI